MTKEELMGYLKTAISVETDIATQESIIADYKENCLLRKPSLSLRGEPPKPNYPASDNTSDSAGVFICFIMGIVIAVSSLLGMFFTGFTGVSIVLIILGLLMCTPEYSYKKTKSDKEKENERTYQTLMQKYDEQLKSVRNENSWITELYNKNLSEWNNNNTENIAILQEPLKNTCLVREQLYSNDFIYSKYQNLPALTSIYEYLFTGRCEELTGPHGAYNLYEDEVRKNTIISQLNVVINNLEQIKQNQYMLYQQVKQIKDETATISNELRQIKGYTINLTELAALNTYYSALTARNTEVSAAYHILNG